MTAHRLDDDARQLLLLPLHQLATANAGHALTCVGSARLEGLSRPGRYRFVGLGQRLVIRALSEHALQEARAALQQACGGAFTLGEPGVHHYFDEAIGAVMVPWIFLRAEVPRWSERELRQLLLDTEANIQDMHRQKDRVIVRAEVAMRRSLGLEASIADITDGRGHYLSWLLGYRSTGLTAAVNTGTVSQCGLLDMEAA